MKVGDHNAIDVGFWWARSNYTGKLTVIEVVTREWADEDDDFYGVLRIGSSIRRRPIRCLNLGSPMFPPGSLWLRDPSIRPWPAGP